MPWKEVNTMSLRSEFVFQALEPDANMSELCRDYGISRKTGYKWIERYLDGGLEGLDDRSRRPKISPTELSENVVCEIIKVRNSHKTWGPNKLKRLIERRGQFKEIPSSTSIHRILDKSGLIKRRKKRKRRPPEICKARIEANAPNDVWTIDFKGWWRTSNGERCEPLTIRDEYSRYILAIKALDTTRREVIQRHMTQVFEKYGLPKVFRSDNGAPFACTRAVRGLSRLSAWWVALGIRLDRIDLGHPEQNGGHERMHLDIRNEIQGQIDGDLDEYQASFDQWRQEFNWVRPHQAINYEFPGSVYKKSKNVLPNTPPQIIYPKSFISRKVNRKGVINFKNQEFFISTSLTHYNVGIKPKETQTYEVWFDYLYLGKVDINEPNIVRDHDHYE